MTMKRILAITLPLLLAACAKDYGDLTETTHKNIDKIVGWGAICENGTERDVACGLNGRGARPQKCESGEWVDDGDCLDPDECIDGDTRISDEGCGLNGRGEQPEKCVNGSWAYDGSCVDPDECLDDEKRTKRKTVCMDTLGDQPQICDAGQWVNDGLCIILPLAFTPSAGDFYGEGLQITITTETAGVSIRCTIDDSEPNKTTDNEYVDYITV